MSAIQRIWLAGVPSGAGTAVVVVKSTKNKVTVDDVANKLGRYTIVDHSKVTIVGPWTLEEIEEVQ